MKRRWRIGVLYGGVSSEREVSLITGKAVFDNLDRKKYKPVLIDFTGDRKFLATNPGKKTIINFYGRDRKKFDLIFIALHGTVGEDGAMQGFFESLGIPYT